MYIGATGMQAQQTNVDTISNNLANVNTAGFKKNRVNFEDLIYRTVAKSNDAQGASEVLRLGVGTGISSTGKIFTVGDLKKTEAPLDIAIRGDGFLEVTLPDGSSGYTRNGSLQINRDGFLATSDGNILKPSIQIPADAKDIAIDATGHVTVSVPTDKNPIEIGQVELVNFINPSGLQPIGNNLYLSTEKSGDASLGKPGENGFGSITQGFLESSNVKLVEEMINLIIAQRAYEINSKVVQASDELLSMSNNLRR